MILCINTSVPAFSAALLGYDGRTLGECLLPPLLKGFSGFMPLLHNLLEGSDVSMAGVEALAVARGPGSFNGLRVGLAAAKGICQALRIPLVGVSSLEAMAHQVPFCSTLICPIIDSRKGEVFAALYRWEEDSRLSVIKKETSVRMEDLSAFAGGRAVVLGNDYAKQAPRVREALGPDALPAPAFLWNLRASAVGAAGLARILEKDFDSLPDLVPSYLRPPDIRPNQAWSEGVVE